MSDYQLALISLEPRFVPSEERATTAATLLRRLLGREASLADGDIQIRQTAKPQFVSCMGNFESISCPHCGANLELAWWHDRMDLDYDGDGFALSVFPLPCCGRQADLNQLRYHFPQGFACFIISCLNPAVAELSPAQLVDVGGTLGCEVRQIYAKV